MLKPSCSNGLIISLLPYHYLMWEENHVPPILTLEMVSQAPGGEYERKREIYRKLGVLYYAIYNPEYGGRDGHGPFEVYKLINGDYQLQAGEPLWMPEIGLGLGRRELEFGGIRQEGLSWFDSLGKPFLNAGELAQQAEQRRQQAEQRQQQAEQEKERLAAKLRELGVDPNEI